jgi:hypothetical protein
MTKRCVLLALGFLASIAPAFAQQQDDGERETSSFFLTVARRVAFDPTTYAPSGISYAATRLDWSSSQVFFRHGFVEQNPRFTISGRPHDVPLSHGAGNQKILTDSLRILQMSVVNNVTTSVVEHLLINRYPHRRQLLQRLGWIERIAFSSYWSYRLSAAHLRKWRENDRLARQLGYR